MERSMSVTQAASAMSDAELDRLCISTIRSLSMDAVQEAKSGHPGTPMALGRMIGMKTFGAPAPLKKLPRKFRFEPECVVAAAREAIGRK
jgi:transketolase